MITFTRQQQLILNVMKTKGTTLSTIYRESGLPTASVRRTLHELVKLGTLAKGSERGTYRIVIQE